MARDDLSVIELFAQHFRDDDAAAGPDDVVRVNRPVGRGDVRHAAAGPLGVRHVLQPLGVKRPVVKQVSFAPRFLRAVAEPALPFIALRAIWREALIMSAYAPYDG